jgi:hypothetical protein
VVGGVQELDVALEVIYNESLHPFKIRMERFFDLRDLRSGLHLLEEEAEGNLDTSVVGEVSKLGSFRDVFLGSVDLTVCIVESAKILEELYRELEVLKKVKTCTDGEAILKLVLCVVKCLFGFFLEFFDFLFINLIADERLCENEGTESDKVKTPLNTKVQLCKTGIEFEFLCSSVSLFFTADNLAKVCTLDLIGEFRLDCKTEGEGKFEGETEMIVVDTVQVSEEVFLIDGGGAGTETGYNTNLGIGNHYGSHCNCDDSKKFLHDRLDI